MTATHPVETLARLTNTIRCLTGRLEEWEHVDEDLSWIGGGKGPPNQIRRGADSALHNLRDASAMIVKADDLAKQLPETALLRETKEALQLAMNAIADADTYCEFALQMGDREEAIECAQNAMLRAHKRAGATLEQLAAKLQVAARDGFPGMTPLPIGEVTSTVHDDKVKRPAKPTRDYCLVSPNIIRWEREVEVAPLLWHLLGCILDASRNRVAIEQAVDEIWRGKDVAQKTIQNTVSRLSSATLRAKFPWQGLSAANGHISPIIETDPA